MGELIPIFAQNDVGFFADFLNVLARGLALGGVYATIALGFVIIFKATQVLNFAQGALAAIGGLFLSFLVFDRPNEAAPRGQTPGTWWRAPFAGDGFPDFAQQWASIILIAFLAGLAVHLLSGGTIQGKMVATGLIGFVFLRWLSTRAGFTFLDNEALSLIIALVVGLGVGLATSWRPSVRMITTTVGAFGLLILIALSDSVWIEWFGNLVVAIIFGAVLGMVLERIAIRPMVGQPLFSLAVITLGLEIALRQSASDSVRILNRPVQAPWGNSAGGDGGFVFLGAFYNWSIIAILIGTALAFIAVYFFYRSKLGVAMRAVSFDQEAAMAQGINVGQVFSIAWAAGTALAVLGGVFATQPPIATEGSVTLVTALVAFRALPAVILGGLDSIQGALIGGLVIGVAEISAGQYLSRFTDTLGPGYQTIVPYVVMLIVLLVRPFGLYGTPEIRRV